LLNYEEKDDLEGAGDAKAKLAKKK